MNILIVSALPQEYAPLAKHTPPWKHFGNSPFKRYSFDLGALKIVLVESGMGAAAAGRVLESEFMRALPDLLVFAGFAGGLHTGLKVGTVSIVEQTRELGSKDSFHFVFPERLREFIASHGLRFVCALTAHQPQSKRALSSVADGEQPSVLDMETAPIAGFCFLKGVPFICFRSVSDAVDDDLGFDVKDITDGEGKVSLPGVFRTVVRNPRTLAAFYHSWRRSTVASNALCAILSEFLRLPAHVLEEIARNTRLTPSGQLK